MKPIRLLLTALSALTLLAGNGFSATTAPTAAPPGPKLGLMTYTLRNLTFEEVVAFADIHHIRYLEFIDKHLDPKAPVEETQRKLSILREHQLIPYTFGVARTSADATENRKLFDFARLIGAKLIVVEPHPEDWDSLEALVKEYGDIRLAIHNHGKGTRFGDPETVKHILATRDSRIGVCLDVGWVTVAGYDAAEVFRSYGDRVFDMHFKDKRRGLVEGKPVGTDTEIGQGDANYAGLFTAIRETHWSGVMAIETDSPVFAANPDLFVTQAEDFFWVSTKPGVGTTPH